MKGLRQVYFVRSQKGRMSAWKGEWENTISGKQRDSVQEETPTVSFSHGRRRGQKVQSSSPAPKSTTQTDGRKASKGFGPRGQSPSGRKGQKACKKKSSKESAWIRRVIIGIVPYAKITSLYRDARSATNVCSDILRLTGSPVKSRRKVVEKDR